MNSRTLRETLYAAGYNIDRLPAYLTPGKFYRFPAPGERKTGTDGWLRLHTDTVASYGNWSTGEKHIWHAANDNRPRPANDNRPPAHRRAPDPASIQQAAAKRARAAWDSARPCTEHPYLTRKRVASYGLRVARDALLLPVYDATTGEQISLQTIDPTGQKRFIAGGRLAMGCYTIPGTEPRVFCEGYATGATVHEATGRTVIVCFDAGNLEKVAAAIARPGDVVAADNDNAEKPGARFDKRLADYGRGHRAALATGLPFYMPHTPGQDWNDAGAEATAAAFATEPTSAAPILNAWSLKRAKLHGTTPKQWAEQLSQATGPLKAAALAYTVAARRFLNAPAMLSLAQIRASIEAALPPGLVHPVTLDRIVERLDAAMQYRQRAALEAVTIPEPVKARHNVQTVQELAALKPDDYNGVIVLRAPMGAGKTRHVGKPFIAHAIAQGDRPLAICHRVSLVHDMAAALGITHYGEIDQHTAHDPAVKGLATCLPSITLRAHAPIVVAARYVFIDEISQVLRFLASTSHCRTREADAQAVYARLVELVRRADCVMVADAGMDRRTVEFLEHCRPGERFRIIDMDPKREGIEADYYTGASAPVRVMGEVLAELAAGGRAWIATESKTRAKTLGAYLEAQGYNVLTLHADNAGQPAQRTFLADPEGQSRQYDAIVASPIIGSGVSIEHRDTGAWFTLGAYVGGGHRVTPADAAQALRRVRYLRRYVLGIIPNTEVGRQSPDSILAAWQTAAAIEGEPARASSYDALVADIRASEANARADFAAGLLWQLHAARWTLRRGTTDTDEGMACELAATRDALAEKHRADLIAAPILTEAQAARIEGQRDRNNDEQIALEAHRIRRALGVNDLDDETLDFWDNGAAVARLDRFSAWTGRIPAYDDTREGLARRRYWRATAKLYNEIFAGIDLTTARVTDELANIILDRIIARRHLCAHLGIAGRKYGIWAEDKDGNLLPFPRPKNARQELADILARMGLAWKRREGTATPTLPITTLGNLTKGGGKPARVRFYQVTPESLATMEAWLERRNTTRSTVGVATTPANDDAAYWRDIRARLIAQAATMTRPQGEALILDSLNSRGPTPHAWLTARWWQEDQAARHRLTA